MTREQQAIIDKLVSSPDEESKRRVIDKAIPLFEFLVFKTIDSIGIEKSNTDYEDIVQNARISLFRSFMEYSEGEGTSFITYAITSIRNSITNSLVNMSWSKSGQRKQWNLTNLSRKFALEYGRIPTREELADAMDISVEDFDDYLKASRAARPAGAVKEDVSMGIELMDDTSPVANVILSVVESLDETAKFCMLKHLDGYTYREIADALSISSSRVGQIILKSRAIIAEELKKKGYDYG